jgi:hypothetical protein
MKKRFWFKFYKVFIEKICDFIIKEKAIKNINKVEKDTAFAHFLKSQEIIKIYFMFKFEEIFKFESRLPTLIK